MILPTLNPWIFCSLCIWQHKRISIVWLYETEIAEFDVELKNWKPPKTPAETKTATMENPSENVMERKKKTLRWVQSSRTNRPAGKKPPG